MVGIRLPPSQVRWLDSKLDGDKFKTRGDVIRRLIERGMAA